MIDIDLLYQSIGRKIRAARERSVKKLSQNKLAKQLGISRASIVNIEAGRQHASLHLLWQIAEALEIDLVMLIPSKEELMEAEVPINLDEKTLRQIEQETEGDPIFQKQFAKFISTLKTSIKPTPNKE